MTRRKFSLNLAGIAHHPPRVYTTEMSSRCAIILALYASPLFCRAHESGSSHYSNLSVGGGQALGTATPSETPSPRKAPPAPTAVIRAPPAPQPVQAPATPRPFEARWFAAAVLVIAASAFILRRREGARRRASSETLALAAHELQSPLAAIESYLDLMVSEAPAQTHDARVWLEDLGRMRTTTTHLRRTIGDILDMTRVEDGRMKLALKPVELGPVLQSAAAAYAPHAAARGVRLKLDAPSEPVCALADPDRLRQVLDNLIGNAVKFTPSGKTVSLAARAAGTEAFVEVSDEGVGVPTGKRDRLFGKFSRLGPAVDGTEGTGLGLYLSRRLVEAQDGHLEYEPLPSGGSLFRVTLPKTERG